MQWQDIFAHKHRSLDQLNMNSNLNAPVHCWYYDGECLSLLLLLMPTNRRIKHSHSSTLKITCYRPQWKDQAWPSRLSLILERARIPSLCKWCLSHGPYVPTSCRWSFIHWFALLCSVFIFITSHLVSLTKILAPPATENHHHHY
jgi:hypothetical protein